MPKYFTSAVLTMPGNKTVDTEFRITCNSREEAFQLLKQQIASLLRLTPEHCDFVEIADYKKSRPACDSFSASPEYRPGV